ncbi:MAG: substrate-binding domain-containing protein [Actinobacteria bacterium]|nr:substrate-binding domain-containing protein [Actinomycetota bacterium]
MRNFKKAIAGIIIAALAIIGCMAATACTKDAELILASTTSTQDSGLFDELIPAFEKASGYKVKVIAVGSGEAIKLGEQGEADVLLVHSRKAEDQFVTDGYGIDRKDVMYNDFIIVGPESDPAKINNMESAVEAFKAIADSGSVFLSRADKSGTHTKELSIWEKAQVEPVGDWYIETGQGMGETLIIAQEKLGYTLTDNATWFATKSSPGSSLVELVKGDTTLYNPYGVIAVNPDKHPDLKINYKGAKAFIDFITGAQGQKIIKEFGVTEYGKPLFHPDVIK